MKLNKHFIPNTYFTIAILLGALIATGCDLLKVENPNTKVVNEVVLEGLAAFFG